MRRDASQRVAFVVGARTGELQDELLARTGDVRVERPRRFVGAAGQTIQVVDGSGRADVTRDRGLQARGEIFAGHFCRRALLFRHLPVLEKSE
jgi:hypothetical protein